MKFVLFFIASILVLSSCGNMKDKKDKDEGGKDYTVVTILPRSTVLYTDYPATLKGQQTVEIRPRVEGYIQRILVDEGAMVRKGQLLFELNSDEPRQEVRSALADIKVAQADVAVAQMDVNKKRPLVEKNIISHYELESAQCVLKSKQAALAQARVKLENAKINLRYTHITSPASGLIGTFPYRVGSLVNSSIAQPLTVLSDISKVYAYFSMNEKEFLDFTRGIGGRTLQEKLKHLPAVSFILADNTPYKHAGRIETASGIVDTQTGSIQLRASFLNPEGVLRSGGSGTVRIPKNLSSALLIPQKATYEIQGKYFVYVVGNDRKVKNTEIKILDANSKTYYVVTSGIHGGDRIVLDGVNKLKDGMRIIPHSANVDSLYVSNSGQQSDI
ncbi:MAG: efflux RND transporter periplasmic adaptor subunit [Bacteroidota bacterium]|nr:efflux RND transporter periplasmic adaptor subunit [Bacteroidota bacterium]